MLTFTKAYAAHLQYFTPSAVQTVEYRELLSAPFAGLIDRSVGWSGWGHGQRCVGMAGVFPIWEGRAEAWALIGEGAQRYALGIVRKAREVLDGVSAHRVELNVKTSNVEGHRLAILLGFEYESTARKYHPDGSDVDVFVRLR